MRFPVLRPGQRTNQQSASAWNHLIQMVTRVANLDVVPPLRKTVHAGGIRISMDTPFVPRNKPQAGALVGVVISVRPTTDDVRLTVRRVKYTYNDSGGQEANWASDPFQVLPAIGHVARSYESSHCDREQIIRDAPNYTVIVPKGGDDGAPETRLLEAPYLGYRTAGAGGDQDGFPYMGRIIIDSRGLSQPSCTYEPLILNRFGKEFTGTGIKRPAICAPGYVYGDYVHLGFEDFLSGSTRGHKNFRLIHSVRSYRATESTFETGGVVMEYIERP